VKSLSYTFFYYYFIFIITNLTMEKSTIYVGKLMVTKLTDSIGNLAPQVDEEALRAAFIPFGEIKSVDIPIDHVTGILSHQFSILCMFRFS
jgi:RNA recognition motif-containing protein